MSAHINIMTSLTIIVLLFHGVHDMEAYMVDHVSFHLSVCLHVSTQEPLGAF
jgi:hypothetical protein